jgi:hypothetical protein
MAGRPFEFLLSIPQDMKRELKPEEREEIVTAVAAGDRVKATSLYLSATEGNLTDAQNFVRSLTQEKIEAAREAETNGSKVKR